MNICINNLVGLPASGKTTFAQQLIEYSNKNPNQFSFSIIHLCYDDFIKLDKVMIKNRCENNKLINYLNNKQYRKDRFNLIILLKQIIYDIKNCNNNFTESKNVIFKEFPYINIDNIEIKFPKQHELCKNYLLIIDDNMYYKSMRNQILNIAKQENIGYYVTYFEIDLDNALESNRLREQHCIPNEFVEKMYKKFDIPILEDNYTIFKVNRNNQSNNNYMEIFPKINEITFNEMIKSKIKQNLKNNVEQKIVDQKHIQSKIHKIDLILRKEISIKINNYNRLLIDNDRCITKKQYANILCEKRKLLLQQIRNEDLEIPDDLNDLKIYL